MHFKEEMAEPRFGAYWSGRPEGQIDAAAGAPRAAEDVPAADKGAQAFPAPVQAFDSTLVGNSRLSYDRHVKPRTSDVSTSVAPQTDDQPDA
nr:hypothetical protein [Tanacetum cinerariifolium]